MVKKEIRDMCVFAVHNFLKDPAFGKMDFYQLPERIDLHGSRTCRKKR